MTVLSYVNYFDCPYAEDDEVILSTFNPLDYPCHHPRNTDHTCPLRNKNEGQRVDCALLKD